MEDIPFKSRAQGAVDSERMQLLSIIAHYWDDLESYEYGGGTQKQKWDLWDDIGKEFNAHPNVTVTRTPLQIKTLFKNMKTKARKYKMKLESCKLNGIIAESDPVSEAVLQLTNVQNKEASQVLLESLKDLRYFDSVTNTSIPTEDRLEIDNDRLEIDNDRLEIDHSQESSNSPDWRMNTDSEDIPDIKEEVIEAFDSPCIIREDQSPISFPLTDDRSENSSDDNASGSDNIIQQAPEVSNSSEVHTFGDLSVTPLTSEKKSAQNGLKIVSPLTLGIAVQQQALVPEQILTNDNNIVSNRIILQPKSILNSPMTVGFVNISNLIDRDSTKRLTSQSNESPSFLNKQYLNTSLNTHSDKLANGKSCCCPEYHKQMLSLAQKEHEMNISLMNEKILAKREERRLHEEERKFREQNFLLKQEERRASLAEHQARMKLIELECEVTQKKCKINERANRWILRNGSKEI